ncbi:SPOR domain-containing protein [Aliivibrio fischeri]|uniref:SPOR domain-containing protein n=1 Tax=Aliivibrio fischeri TaxID=668 RepID=UPI0012D8F766|nr:SPOR domain-containing protein [Aliivibrio fischeri]MUK30738.1 SPOR domain-containing protein [Aliivibrio fischeri]
MTQLIKITKISLGVLSSVLVMTHAYANDASNDDVVKKESALTSICFSKDAHSDAKNVLLDACPIGDGLWGNQKPKLEKGKSEFWIQCGVFNQELTKEKVNHIQKKVDASINFKLEGEAKRCLIGPYQDFTAAQKQLRSLQSDRLFKHAALREVNLSLLPQVEEPIERASETVSEPEPDPITIRKQTKINNLHFVVPFTDDSSEGFYMENSLPWLRATSLHAQEICQQIDMDLVTKEQWQILLDSTIMTKDKWPVLLPYWGADNLGLFKDGAARKLKNTSMLNVMCTKKVEDEVVGNPI